MGLKKIKNKKGYFFSLDAFIALLIILGIVIFIKPASTQISDDSQIQDDLLLVLSSVKIGEINNVYVQQLISEGKITELNQSVLEQIGEFYANSEPEAELLAASVIGQMNIEENVGLYFNGVPVYTSYGAEPGSVERIFTSRQIISGIQQGESAKGYSSRAFLSSENKVDYFYFGGYVGDGNLTVNLGRNVISVSIEAVFSGGFDLYINNIFVESYTPTANIPYEIDLSSYSALFSIGDNYLDFRSRGSLYVAGGFVKIYYSDNQVLTTVNKNYFPGVEGLMNIYDSFYVPGVLNSMEIFLHYDSPYQIFLTIGNEVVYSGNSGGGEETVTISNLDLSSILDYNDMGEKTIPMRLGLENVSYIFNFTMDADVFSVTDLSGSMDASCNGGSFFCCLFTGNFCGIESSCNSCGGIWEDKIGSAKEANNVFIDFVLNYTENRVGLVGYSSEALDSNYHSLSHDDVSLKAKVDSWGADGSTCICCGINKAVQKIVVEAEPDSFQSMVVMSDGEANVRCSQQGTGNAKQDAVQAACDAYEDYGIKIYTIGFGSDVDESTLQDMSSCGSGNYYYGDIEELTIIYQQVAEDIVNAAYYEQTVVGEGLYTKLYPDSYVLIDYEKTIPYGLVITAETDNFGNTISQGSFDIPFDTTPYEAKVISYSGSKWTDKVEVFDNDTGNWKSIFNLSEYGSEYISLGDPYVVNIPVSEISFGENLVRVSTALNPSNSSGGSEYDKVIYTVVKEISSYSSIVASAIGCNWVIEFEDGTTSEMVFPSGYSGTKECYYTEDNVAYNNNDAIDIAIYNLLSSLDLNSNRKIEIKFLENDLTINSVEVEGIPFTWDTEVQARVWR